MDKGFYDAIALRLEAQANQDDSFREKFSAKMMEDKNSITQCCSWIIKQVQQSKRTAFTDDEIYGMAIHFFDEGLTDNGSHPSVRVVVPGEEKKQVSASAPKKVERKIKPQSKVDESQMSLF